MKDEFIAQSTFRLRDNTKRIKRAFEELEEKEIWVKPNGASNSVGNLILHLIGNISQFILAPLGDLAYERDRQVEFNTKGGLSKAELLAKLDSCVDTVATILEDIPEADLTAVGVVNGYQYSGIGMVMHVVQHFAYHTGQILFWTKYLRNVDLGYRSVLPGQGGYHKPKAL